jgi:hypothetical protein
MAPIKTTSNNHSSRNPSTDSLIRQASVLATCYLVDSSRSGSVSGLHYCTTKATGAGWYA